MENIDRKMRNNSQVTPFLRLLCSREGSPNFGNEPPEEIFFPDSAATAHEMTTAQLETLQRFYGVDFGGASLAIRVKKFLMFVSNRT
jgi:hypothetical protein